MNPPSTIEPPPIGEDQPGPRLLRLAADWDALTFTLRLPWLRFWLNLAGLSTAPLRHLAPSDRVAGLLRCARTVFYVEHVLRASEPYLLADINLLREAFASSDPARWRPYMKFPNGGLEADRMRKTCFLIPPRQQLESPGRSEQR